MNQNVLKVQNENGEEVLYEVLINFTSDEFNKNYMVIVPVDQEKDGGQISVTPVTYTKNEEGQVTGLGEIETREEFEMVKAEFEKMMNQAHDHDHECGCDHDHDGEEHECCGKHNHE